MAPQCKSDISLHRREPSAINRFSLLAKEIKPVKVAALLARAVLGRAGMQTNTARASSAATFSKSAMCYKSVSLSSIYLHLVGCCTARKSAAAVLFRGMKGVPR